MRVDRIGLAALTSALASAGGQVRRDPQHPLAAADQKPLQRPRDVPAVLKRPHPLAIKAARPPQQRIEPAPADLDGLLAQQLAGRGRDSGDRVRTLVSVRAKHDHGPRPPLDPLGADGWRTRLAGGGATHLSSHARHPRPATSDKTRGSQALVWPTASKRVSSPPVGTIPSVSDVTDDPNHNSKPRSSSPADGTAVSAADPCRSVQDHDAAPFSKRSDRRGGFLTDIASASLSELGGQHIKTNGGHWHYDVSWTPAVRRVLVGELVEHPLNAKPSTCRHLRLGDERVEACRVVPYEQGGGLNGGQIAYVWTHGRVSYVISAHGYANEPRARAMTEALIARVLHTLRRRPRPAAHRQPARGRLGTKARR